MVGHDHVQTRRGGARYFVVRRCAAVGGDHQRRAVGRHGVDRAGVQPVALGYALGDVGKGVQAQGLGGLQQHGGRADPVHVVVAVDADPLAPVYRLGDSRHRQVHLVQQIRIVRRQRSEQELVHLRSRVVPAVVQHLYGQWWEFAHRAKECGRCARRDVPDRPGETARGIMAGNGHGASLTSCPPAARFARSDCRALGVVA